MSEWHISNKRLRIDHLIHMADEPLCIVTLMDSACECMELCRDRGLNIDLEIKMINKAFDERNSARLEQLIARVQARFQKFDAAKVGASSASPVQNSLQIEPETSSSVAESQNRIQIRYADQASLAPFPTSSSVAESQNSIQIRNADQASSSKSCRAGISYGPKDQEGSETKNTNSGDHGWCIIASGNS